MALAQEKGSRIIVTTDIAACGSYTWDVNHVTYTADTAVMYINATDDTLFVLNLTVDAPINNDVVLSHNRCSYEWRGQLLTEDGTYYDTVASPTSACDSNFSLQLTLSNTETDTFNINACGQYEWFDSLYTESTTNTHVVVAPECTHTDLLNLTLGTRLHEYDTVTNCGDYMWHNNPYGVTGEYMDSIIDPICDTIFHLKLTVVNDTMEAVTDSACNSLTWRNTVYTASGTYNSYDTNSSNCVSVYTLNLTIKPFRTPVTDTTVSSCGSVRYVINNYAYTFTENTYIDTHLIDNRWNVCLDSNLRLNVIVRSHSTSDTTAIACDYFYWDRTNKTYLADAELKYRLTDTTNAQGCDSSIILHLTIRKSPVIRAINGEWNLNEGDTAVFYPTGTANVVYTWSTTPAAQTQTVGDTLYVYNVQGNIDVTLLSTLTYEDIACYDTSWITIVTYIGIDGTETANVSLYPNPTVGQLNIECSESISEVMVYNSLGQQVALYSNLGTRSLINLSALSRGTYTMRIVLNNGESIIRKVILTK